MDNKHQAVVENISLTTHEENADDRNTLELVNDEVVDKHDLLGNVYVELETHRQYQFKENLFQSCTETKTSGVERIDKSSLLEMSKIVVPTEKNNCKENDILTINEFSSDKGNPFIKAAFTTSSRLNFALDWNHQIQEKQSVTMNEPLRSIVTSAEITPFHSYLNMLNCNVQTITSDTIPATFNNNHISSLNCMTGPFSPLHNHFANDVVDFSETTTNLNIPHALTRVLTTSSLVNAEAGSVTFKWSSVLERHQNSCKPFFNLVKNVETFFSNNSHPIKKRVMMKRSSNIYASGEHFRKNLCDHVSSLDEAVSSLQQDDINENGEQNNPGIDTKNLVNPLFSKVTNVAIQETLQQWKSNENHSNSHTEQLNVKQISSSGVVDLSCNRTLFRPGTVTIPKKDKSKISDFGNYKENVRKQLVQTASRIKDTGLFINSGLYQLSLAPDGKCSTTSDVCCITTLSYFNLKYEHFSEPSIDFNHYMWHNDQTADATEMCDSKHNLKCGHFNEPSINLKRFIRYNDNKEATEVCENQHTSSKIVVTNGSQCLYEVFSDKIKNNSLLDTLERKTFNTFEFNSLFQTDLSSLSSGESSKSDTIEALNNLDGDLNMSGNELIASNNYSKMDIDIDVNEAIDKSIIKYENFTMDKEVLATPSTCDKSSQTDSAYSTHREFCKRCIEFKIGDFEIIKKLKPNTESEHLAGIASTSKQNVVLHSLNHLKSIQEYEYSKAKTSSHDENNEVALGYKTDFTSQQRLIYNADTSNKTIDNADLIGEEESLFGEYINEEENISLNSINATSLGLDQIVPTPTDGSHGHHSQDFEGSCASRETPKKPLLRIGLSKSAKFKPLHSKNNC